MVDAIPEEPLKSFSLFVNAVSQQLDADEMLYRLAEHVMSFLDVAGTGVSLADPDGGLHPVTGINALTTSLENAEVRFGQGPCVDAYRTGSVVRVDDMSTAYSRWPRWSGEARRLGVKAVLGVPLQVRAGPLGGVNIYSLRVRRWEQHEEEIVRMLCDLAASHLASLAELENSRRRADQLQRALDSRVIIEQAKGILASDLDCSVDQAFVVLRDYARRRGADLRAVARAVVQDGFRPTPSKTD